MDLDHDVVASLTVHYQPTAYLRVTPIAYRATPLGMGFGKTRFASPTDAFRLLYIAENLATVLPRRSSVTASRVQQRESLHRVRQRAGE